MSYKRILTLMRMAGTLGVCWLSSFICPVYAGEPADSGDSISLGEVVVRARRPYAEIIPAQTLSGERLDAMRSHNVADAVRLFSGVQVKDYGGVGGVKTIDMRSMGTNHMSIFYDGIQLGNAQNGQIDLGRFSLDNLEAIDIYSGQKSDIFQSAKDYGSAGTLYLQSRRARFEEGQRPWRANVTFRAGSFGVVNPSGRFDVKFSERVTATASIEYLYANGRYKFRYRKLYDDGTTAWDTTATRRNGDLHSLRTELGVYGALSRGYWQGRAYFYDSDRGIPGAIVNNVWKNSQRQWDRNFFVQGHWQQRLSSVYTAQVKAKYARDYMHYLNPDTTLMHIDNRFYQNELYISSANKFDVTDRLDINIAADYQWNTLTASMVNFARPVRNTLLLAAAAAYDGGQLKMQASLLYTSVADRSRRSPDGAPEVYKTSHLDRFTPTLVSSLRLNRDFSLRAYYKRSFRMPTFNDLYYTDIGNASLKPETVDQINLGSVYHHDFMSTVFDALNLTADVYYNHVTDKIIAVPKGNGQYRWMMMNIGKVNIVGVDVTAVLDMTPMPLLHLQGRVNYTYQWARDFSDPTDRGRDGAGTYKGQIAYIPAHSGSAVVSLRYRRAEINYSFIYVGERWSNSSNIPENYVPAWYTSDIALSWTFSLAHTSVKLSGEINNILNQQYEVIENYPMPGRNFKLSVSVEL